MKEALQQIEGTKDLLSKADVSEQIAIMQILLALTPVPEERHVKMELLETASDLVKNIAREFANSSDTARMGLVHAISTSIFKALIKQVEEDTPTEQFKKEYLASLISDRIETLLGHLSDDTEKEIQLLNIFIREHWDLDLDPLLPQHQNFWAFVVKHDLGSQTQRDELLKFINTKN